MHSIGEVMLMQALFNTASRRMDMLIIGPNSYIACPDYLAMTLVYKTV